MDTSALYSRYIIDGVQRDLSPAAMLDAICGSASDRDAIPECAPVVDESIDPGLVPLSLDPAGVDGYLRLCCSCGDRMSLPFAAVCTRAAVAKALIDSIWRQGKFRLDELELTAKWQWKGSAVGDMSAFYASVEAAAGYIDGLGLGLRRYSLSEGEPEVRFATPYSGAPALCPRTFVPDPRSWIIYIPFDTSDYRLGGSRLACALGFEGGIAPQMDDADYFMDCFEVVREFVEDGVVMAGTTVGGGGLMTAARGMASAGTGCILDISDILKASGEEDMVRVLFAELPGVLVQIEDTDFDYVDAELLLQDVVYYPLGHPVPGEPSVRVRKPGRSGIQNILESLIRSQCGEGED